MGVAPQAGVPGGAGAEARRDGLRLLNHVRRDGISPGHYQSRALAASTSFSIDFPSQLGFVWYLFAIAVSASICLDGIYRPIWRAAFYQKTRLAGQRLVVATGFAGHRGSHPLRRPLPGMLGSGPSLRTASPDYNRTALAAPISSWGCSRFRSPLLREPCSFFSFRFS
ncbi:hypothetical protein Tco_0084553 [Tanacetum coccineum]